MLRTATCAERFEAAPDEELCETLLRVNGILRELEQGMGTIAVR
jgi:hypothetical protein